MAADIVRTVAVQPSLGNVAVLGLIVLVRTFLSFSLEVEIDGRWPWQHAGLERAAPLPASHTGRQCQAARPRGRRPGPLASMIRVVRLICWPGRLDRFVSIVGWPGRGEEPFVTIAGGGRCVVTASGLLTYR